jgi:two-component system, OmpR family, sensor histidine kinase BaeS
MPPGWQGGRPRGRPPWWPEGEPWPPTGPPSWARRRWRGCLPWPLLVVLIVAIVATNVFLNRFGHLLLPTTITGQLLLVGILLLFVVSLAVLSRSLGRGARRVTDAATRVEKGDYSARLNERGPGAMADLARAFNSMSTRLEAKEAKRKSFLAEVTHELRTPLAIIRGEAEAIADGVHPAGPQQVARILAAARAVESLVEDLGTLTRSDAGALILKREPVDLALLVNESLGDLRPAAEAAGVTLRAEVAEGLPPIPLDPARIRRVLHNLVANALRHTPEGGTVTVSAAPSRAGVAITVQDSGSGIAPDLFPHVFDRFTKDAESPGSGLGLAIARDVVEAHLGTIEAASPPGEGTTVRIWLPVV